MSQKNFVELRNVSKRFGNNTVIDNITLTIPRGQMVTLLGPSGCGKTTICAWSPGWKSRATGRYSLMVKTSLIVPYSSVISAWCSSLMPCSRICHWERTSAMG